MKKRSVFLASLGLMHAAVARAQAQTPAEKVGNSPGSYNVTGLIPNSSPIDSEYFSGSIAFGQMETGPVSSTVTGSKNSLHWYEFVANGVTPITFDLYGSQTAYGGGFGSGGNSNSVELAVYNSSGGFIADNQSGNAPADGDSNVAPVVPAGFNTSAPVSYRQPADPTQPVYYFKVNSSGTSGQWLLNSYQNLANLNFVKNPQSNPLWNPSNPNYNQYANWNQYPILPAGSYFLAVAGYKTDFSGNPADAAVIDSDPGDSGGYTSTSPFGFIDYSPQAGTYELNARITGDFNGDGVANLADLRLLRLQVAFYNSSQGIAGDGYDSGIVGQGNWIGLESDPTNPLHDLQQYDMTGNGRIDKYDIAAWGRYTGNSTIVSLTWNNTAAASGTDPYNPGGPGDGVAWDIETSQNFNDTVGTDVYLDGDLVTFNDSNNGNYNVTLNSTVSPGSLTCSNSAGNYAISGSGGINGSTGLLKIGSANLSLGTVNTYTGGTNVSGGKLLLTVTGALPINSSLIIGPGASVVAVNSSAGSKIVLQTSMLSIAGSSDHWSGLLDLNNNDLIAYNGSLGTITNQIKSGFAGGWHGATGITSSTAAANTTHLTALGVIQNSTNGLPTGTAFYPSFDGVPVVNSDVLVKYTYYGDATLAGSVSSIDYTLIDAGYLSHGTLTGWANGDFNYDGIVNGSDYTLIDNAFNQQGVQLSTEIASSAAQIAPASSVPEPTAVVLVVLGGVGLLGRRRLRQS
jgi:autotransporter-associated beta strand protein